MEENLKTTFSHSVLLCLCLPFCVGTGVCVACGDTGRWADGSWLLCSSSFYLSIPTLPTTYNLPLLIPGTPLRD